MVGAGHLQGLAKHLRESDEAPEAIRTSLETLKKTRNIPWFKIAMSVVIVGGIGFGFWRGGFSMGADLLRQWVMFTASLAALGCLLAGGHVPVSYTHLDVYKGQRPRQRHAARRTDAGTPAGLLRPPGVLTASFTHGVRHAHASPQN